MRQSGTSNVSTNKVVSQFVQNCEICTTQKSSEQWDKHPPGLVNQGFTVLLGIELKCNYAN